MFAIETLRVSDRALISMASLANLTDGWDKHHAVDDQLVRIALMLRRLSCLSRNPNLYRVHRKIDKVLDQVCYEVFLNMSISHAMSRFP
jgi:hypothetical protein